MPLPSTADLLASGGDHRIALDPVTGRNQYGCEPMPGARLVSFGSSTSSGISPAALAAVDKLRLRLDLALRHEAPAAVYLHEMERLRAELLALCGIDPSPHLPDPGIVFSASGTDVHLLAARIAARVAEEIRLPGDDAARGIRPLVIVAGEAESGSGVRAALAGQHFSTYNALGRVTVPGEVLAPACDSEIRNVPIREEDGSPRPAAAVDADIDRLAGDAVRAGRHVLLLLIDVSKTGCIAPSVACVTALQRRWPASVQVLVDACQFRIEPATLQAYLGQGFMVALTGSKFLTGPSFSGALLLPPDVGVRLRRRGVPAELRMVSAREEWPRDWACAQVLGSFANFGLLMRWQAAMHELRAFRAVPPYQVAGILERFAEAVQQRLRHDPSFAPLPVPALDRGGLDSLSRWDCIQTIHPFLLYRTTAHGGRVALSRAETAVVYRRLQQAGFGGTSYQVGQPVDCGQRWGVPVSALRLCGSARLVVQAAQGYEQERRIVDEAMACLDEIAMLAHSLEPAPAALAVPAARVPAFS